MTYVDIYKVSLDLQMQAWLRNLQPFLGYVIQPTDGSHYVRLFADAQFYGCGLHFKSHQI